MYYVKTASFILHQKKSFTADLSVLQERAGKETLDLHLKNEMQILNFQLRLPCQKRVLYIFLMAAKTPR